MTTVETTKPSGISCPALPGVLHKDRVITLKTIHKLRVSVVQETYVPGTILKLSCLEDDDYYLKPSIRETTCRRDGTWDMRERPKCEKRANVEIVTRPAEFWTTEGKIIIAASAVAGVLGLLVLVTALICYRRKVKNSKKNKESFRVMNDRRMSDHNGVDNPWFLRNPFSQPVHETSGRDRFPPPDYPLEQGQKSALHYSQPHKMLQGNVDHVLSNTWSMYRDPSRSFVDHLSQARKNRMSASLPTEDWADHYYTPLAKTYKPNDKKFKDPERRNSLEFYPDYDGYSQRKDISGKTDHKPRNKESTGREIERAISYSPDGNSHSKRKITPAKNIRGNKNTLYYDEEYNPHDDPYNLRRVNGLYQPDGYNSHLWRAMWDKTGDDGRFTHRPTAMRY